MKNLYLSALACAFLLAGCGKDEVGTNGGGGEKVVVSKGIKFAVLNGSVEKDGDKLSGNATLASMVPVPDDHGYKFTLTFSLKDGGTFALLSNGGERLKDAFVVSFSRSKDKLSNASIVFPDGSKDDFTELLAEKVDVRGDINVPVEIHNHGDETHVIIKVADKEILNKEYQPLAGRNWGVRLESSTYVLSTLLKAEHH